MKIGYACTPLLVNYKTTRKFVLKNFSDSNFLNTTKENISDFKKILEYNLQNNILMFRISSDIIPFGSHEVLSLPWFDIFKDELNDIGSFIKNNNMRVSMHPGQYTVLNSPDENTAKKAIIDLEYHCKFLDSLNIDFTHKIILHVGGVYGDKSSALLRFQNNFNKLSSSLKNRLIIENDEKNFNIADILSLSSSCEIPIVYDNLHEGCFNDCRADSFKILKEVFTSWKSKDGIPKVHFSQQDPQKKKGSHAPYLFSEDFLSYIEETSSLDFDIMIELKDKDISALKAISLLKDKTLKLSDLDKNEILQNYSYLLKSYGDDIYLKSKELLNISLLDFYTYTEKILQNPPNEASLKNTLKEIYISIEDIMNQKEVNHFHKLLKEEKLIKAKEYLLKVERSNTPLPIKNFFYYY